MTGLSVQDETGFTPALGKGFKFYQGHQSKVNVSTKLLSRRVFCLKSPFCTVKWS